jgi:phosphoserine phosphatase
MQCLALPDGASYLVLMNTKSPLQQIPDAFFERYSSSDGFPRPLAVFDCDGTVIQGDIGESMFYRQIEHFAFRVSPAEILTDHPHRDELARTFDTLVSAPESRRKDHAAFEPFARLLLTRYFEQLAEGKTAKACAEIVQLFAGFSLDEVRHFAEETLFEELQVPMHKSPLGGQSLPRGVRFLRETVNLVQALQKHGFDIVAVSGSNKWSVEPVFARLGVPRERVLGIDLHTRDNLLTPETKTPVPIHGGKVDLLRLVDPRPPVLVASDSRNDIPLLLASTDLRVYVNSHKRVTEDFFTLGKVARDDSWVVIENPEMILD